MFLKDFDLQICDEIVNWFLKTSYAKDMDNCLNGVDEHHLNPYHQERSVLDHSLMVANKAIEYWSNDPYFYVYFISSLVHDIGKIRARSVEMRNSSGEMMCIFRNHENMGFYPATDVLFDFWKTDIARKINFSYDHIVDILKLVLYHDIYKYSPEETFLMYRNFRKDIAKFSICDTKGRIMDKEKDISKYDEILNSDDKIVSIDTSKHRITLMIGLPSSGKSTFSKYCSGVYKYIISRDEIVENFDKYINEEEYSKLIYQYDLRLLKESLKTTIGYQNRFKLLHKDNDFGKYVDKIFMHMYHKAIISNDGNILIDKTNLSKKGRNSLFTFNTRNTIGVSNKLLKERFDNFIKSANVLVRPYKLILESDQNRDKSVGKEIIDKFIYSSNFPNYSEFDYIGYETITKIGKTIEKEGSHSELIEKHIRNEIVDENGYCKMSNIHYWLYSLDVEKAGVMELYDGYAKFKYLDSYVKVEISI